MKCSRRKIFFLFTLGTVISVVILIYRVESNAKCLLVGNRPNQQLFINITKRGVDELVGLIPNWSKSPSLIVVVNVQGGDFKARVTARKYWAALDKLGELSIRVLFVIADKSPSMMVTEEAKQFGDILTVKLSESYRNLVYKLLCTYRWILLVHPDSSILKTDSDVAINPINALKALEAREDDSIIGHKLTLTAPRRSPCSKWYVPYTAYSGLWFPTYCSGFGYLIPAASLSKMISVVHEVTVFEVEDVFFTGVLASHADISRVDLGLMAYGVPDSVQCEDGKSQMIAIASTDHLMTNVQVLGIMDALPCSTIWLPLFD